VAFEQVSAAYKLPRADAAQKAERSEAIQAALQSAAAVPLETMRLCADVLELAEEAAPLLNPAVISDVLVGAQLAQAGLESAALNVEINLAAMTDLRATERLARASAATRDGAAQRLASIVEVGRSRFPQTVQKS
jgi:methenyltetrahydrofolate cyclohydrolase